MLRRCRCCGTEKMVYPPPVNGVPNVVVTVHKAQQRRQLSPHHPKSQQNTHYSEEEV